MCIIVDTNKLGAFLADPADEDSRPIRRWLDRGAGSLVYSTGGRFGQEIRGRVRPSWPITFGPAGRSSSPKAGSPPMSAP